MSKQSISTLKNWFKRGLKPLEEQFAHWLDSYWHKDANDIPISSIQNLESTLNDLATVEAVEALDTAKEDKANKGQPNGYASLDGGGKVPAGQLPSYVDDVLEFANLAAFPVTGETGKIFIAIDTNLSYRWSGSIYIQVTSVPSDASTSVKGIVQLDTDGNIQTNANSGRVVTSGNLAAWWTWVKTQAQTFAAVITFTSAPRFSSMTASKFMAVNATKDLIDAPYTPEDASKKDATGGYAGLTLFKINFKNVANTFTSFFTNVNTAARTYTFPDKDIAVAGLDDIQTPSPASATAAGTATYTASLTPAIAAYVANLRVFIKFTNANTGASTLNLNGLGAKAIKKNSSDNLVGGDIVAGQIVELFYDGTNFQAMGLTKLIETQIGGLTQDSVTLSIYKESNFGTP